MCSNAADTDPGFDLSDGLASGPHGNPVTAWVLVGQVFSPPLLA